MICNVNNIYINCLYEIIVKEREKNFMWIEIIIFSIYIKVVSNL